MFDNYSTLDRVVLFVKGYFTGYTLEAFNLSHCFSNFSRIGTACIFDCFCNQRREYYRFSCALDMCARNLEEEEIEALEKNSPYELQPGLPLKHSVIVDISGGGLRFLSSQKYEPGSLILCSYHLLKDGERKKYDVVGKVLAVKELENRRGMFEHRVQYYNLDVNTREEIIRFIFEEERKSRKKERLN